MKAVTTAAKQTIQQGIAVNAVPRLLAEWEYNRFVDINEIWASPTQTTTDPDYVSVWDINSLGLPNRPRSGIAKARMDEPSVMTLDQYRDYPQESRFYPADPSDTYKYWTTVDRSHLSAGDDGGYAFDNPVEISLSYQNPVNANKIVLGFETSYSKPLTYTVEVSTDGTNFYSVSSDPVMDVDGTVTLWLNADHQWDTVPYYKAVTPLQGVRVTVYSMTNPYVHLDVLQLGLRLENDLTDFLVKYDVEMQMSDRSFIVPLGKASSNQATVTLSNIDGRFNDDNPNSLYAGMIDKRVKMTLDLGIDATPKGGSKYEYVREFTGWVDSWGTQTAATTDVSLKDSSVFLQDMVAPQVFFEGSTVGGIIWQIMDRIGMANYSYVRADAEAGTVVPYYWPDKQKFVWNELQDLAEATQYAIYFDEYDVLQIRSRESLFSPTDPVVWNFDAVPNGSKLPDIIDLDINKDMLTNHVLVTYKPTHYSDFQNGLPKMEQVWQPTEQVAPSGATTSTGSDPTTGVGTTSTVAATPTSASGGSTDVVLRSCPIVKDVLAGADSLWIRQVDTAFWPYNAIINLRGEMLEYDGKEYVYYAKDGTVQTVVIHSQADKQNIDSQGSDEYLAWKNYFTGRLMIKGRAMYGTTQPAIHPAQSYSYTGFVSNYFNTKNYRWDAGINYMQGYAQLHNIDGDANTYWTAKHPNGVTPRPGTSTVTYGTRIRFPNLGDKVPGTRADGTPDIPTIWGVGGLYICGDAGRSGLYLEISPSSVIDDIEKRNWRHEISLVGQDPNGAWRFVSDYNTKNLIKNDDGSQKADDNFGWQTDIFYDVWYDVDVVVGARADGGLQVTVYLNSVLAGEWTVGGPTYNTFRDGRFGAFVRGWCNVDYDYLYAVNVEDTALDPDSTGFLDLVSGDFSSGYIERYWRYGFGYQVNAFGTTPYPPSSLRQNYAFDEFGSQVHECRRFTVNFGDSNVPCEHSFLYLTNEGQSVVLYYNANAFGADFMVANASRNNVVLNGSDENNVNHTMFIYGRQLYQDDDLTVEKRHDLSIRRRGQAQVTFNSKFIQTADMANALGDWVTRLWGTGVDEATMNVFGNPFLQLGDLVTINYPVKDMLPSTHKYFVVDIKNTFDSGYKTSVILRRAGI